jgi:hydrogenase nickel incorporation protein HypB
MEAGSHHHHHREPQQGSNIVVDVNARILARNDALAAENRSFFTCHGITALNLMSAPGAGKTTLLERTLNGLKGKVSLFVIEGDQATANDAERIRAAGIRCIQINTGAGCHLDAHMVAHAVEELAPGAGSVLFIENVGNLVCPAMFDLGEQARVVIFSVTEGEDKPLKYPHMFRAADIVLLNKIDLLPHLEFDLPRVTENIRRVNATAEILLISARTGQGMDQWYRLIGQGVGARQASA